MWPYLAAEESARRADAAALVVLPAWMQSSGLSVTIRQTVATGAAAMLNRL
jgi:hypothetical protein